MATVVGTRVIRSDGKDKVTGLGRYAADLTLTGMPHAKFRYADHAHARILRIDTSKARALPGVFAVITQDDVPDVRYGAFVQDRTLFARDVVRYEGEVVAAVAALDARDRRARRRADRRRLRGAAGGQPTSRPPSTDGAPLSTRAGRATTAPSDVVREGNDARARPIVKGDADAAHGRRPTSS